MPDVARIDATARVAEGAALGEGVEIGPYCIVGPSVTLGEGVKLVAHVYVTGRTAIGAGTEVHPFGVLGGPPQSVHYKGEDTRLTIGRNCVIREGASIHIGTADGRGETRIGDNCMLMGNVHIGHDCKIADHVVCANNAALAGFVEVGEHAFIGGQSGVHQFTRIGAHAILAGSTACRDDVIPFATAMFNPARLGGLNFVGLRRRGFSKESIRNLRAAYRSIFFGGGTFAERVERTAKTFAGDPAVEQIVAFIRASGKRPICIPRGPGDSDGGGD